MTNKLFTLNYDGTGEATLEGFTLQAKTIHDGDHEPPWQSEDGHGPVSDWRSKESKAPGERILNEDHGRARFYDFAAACKQALEEGWDAEPYNTDKRETPKQQAAKAAEADFGRLKDWCEGRWHYVGVVVKAYKEGVELGSASLWGIESDGDGYLEEVAEELADEAVAEAKAKLAKLAA